MKTLKQLWEENGGNPGLKVKLPEWENSWICIQGLSPKGEAYGYTDDGDATTEGDYHGTSHAIWEIYEEPKHKPKLVLWNHKLTGELKLAPESETPPIEMTDNWTRVDLKDLAGWDV